MTAWTLLVCGASAALLAWLWWAERRRVFQCIISLLAVASLAAWGIPLHWSWASTPRSEGVAILLTEGYNRDSVRAFQSISGKALPVYDGTHGLPLLAPGTGVLHVFGYGLSKPETTVLPPLKIVFHPTPLPDGITSVQWDVRTGQSAPFSLQAHIRRSEKQRAPYKIVLTGFGTTLDSMTLGGQGDTDIILQTIPRGTGRVVYTLSLIANGDTLESDPVPEQVRDPINWSVFLLASAPDFENKFLRQWLAAAGHRVSMRTAISRDKYDAGFANRAPTDLALLPGTFLDSIDILVADPGALEALPGSTLSRILEQVRQRGMGLIIRTDSSLPASLAPGLSFVPGHDTLPAPVSLILSNVPYGALAAQDLRPPGYITYKEAAKPLMTDTHSHIWASSVLSGSGKIVLTTFQTAYRWMLSGDTADYAAYWSCLLQEVARREKSGPAWSASPAIARVREPVTISVLADDAPQQPNNAVPQTGDRIPPAQIAGTDIALRADPLLPFLKQGLYWPLQPGWQIGIDPEGQPWWWYAYAPGDWSGVDMAQREEATRNYAVVPAEGGGSVTPTAAIPAEPEPIPAYYFFIAFLCFAGILWAAKNTRASD